jgi:hypothetical protein
MQVMPLSMAERADALNAVLLLLHEPDVATAHSQRGDALAGAPERTVESLSPNKVRRTPPARTPSSSRCRRACHKKNEH